MNLVLWPHGAGDSLDCDINLRQEMHLDREIKLFGCQIRQFLKIGLSL